MIEAFIAAIAGAIQVIFDKIIVNKRDVTGLALLKLKISFVAICMVIPVIVWGSLRPAFFTPQYILLFIALVLAGIMTNFLYFSALKNKQISEVEPITLLATPIAIILAMIILPDERSLTVIIIATIATAALLLSRFNKKHLSFDKYSWMLLGCALFCAIEAILVKYLSTNANAVSLYGLRTASIAIVFLLLFRNIKIKKIKKKETVQVFANSAITSIESVTRFFAISVIGVVNSSIILLLGPIMILVFSRIFLKEKITLKRGIGDTIIIVCIGAILLFGY